VIARIEELMKHDIAGDPCTGAKWTRRTTRKIAKELKALNIKVSPKTVARILKDLHFSLRVNHKKGRQGLRPGSERAVRVHLRTENELRRA
jgi:arginine repressor